MQPHNQPVTQSARQSKGRQHTQSRSGHTPQRRRNAFKMKELRQKLAEARRFVALAPGHFTNDRLRYQRLYLSRLKSPRFEVLTAQQTNERNCQKICDAGRRTAVICCHIIIIIIHNHNHIARVDPAHHSIYLKPSAFYSH